MQTFEAIYEAGVFRPIKPVSLPDQSRVQITVKAVTDTEAEQQRLDSLESIYEVLDERYSSGETDVAARHNEHQP
jgi:predicted DNA-binding antitoxin AbrB/MazE fold protein